MAAREHNKNRIEIRPQPGKQTDLVSSKADIVIYGGSAGSGKSFGLLLDPLRNHDVSDFTGMIFRRTSVQIRNPGGLWDESAKLYSLLGAVPREYRLEWLFPSGATMTFGAIEYEKDVQNFQGAQFTYCGFDELTHFTEYQFFYMLSRCRSTSGVKPRIRATCNPDPDSWVRKFIDWWIDVDGFPIPYRSGELRWFVRINEDIIWSDSKKQLIKQYGKDVAPKSVTFISAKLDDNKILMKKDPSYLGNLLAMGRVDRMRLLDGNWNVKPSAGNMFRREWFPVVDAVPSGYIDCVRFWDRAATKPNEVNKDPDWTRGLKLYKYADGKYCISDLKSIRDTPFHVERLIKNTASQDGHNVRILAQRDPGSAGIGEAEQFVRMLSGFNVHTSPFSENKLTRAKGVSAQSEVGNIVVLRAEWNDELFNELENFPEGAHDDIIDTLSGAFNELCENGLSIADALWNNQ